MSTIDWAVVAAYFVLSFGIALWYYKRAGQDTEEFFLSGRSLPWWVAGTSMVATTFAADTPLVVAELVAKNGVAGNWLWWNLMFGSVLTVFFFARLWRRAGILTEVELCDLRYSGKPAAFLRGFKAIYLGLLFNCLIIGWVNIAMTKVLKVLFPMEAVRETVPFVEQLGLSPGSVYLCMIAGMMTFVAIYAAISGLWGVTVTDFFQFFLAMGGTIALAVIALNVPEVGGIDGLKSSLEDWRFQFFPDINRVFPETWFSSGGGGGGGEAEASLLQMTLLAFFAYTGVAWWSVLYPGAEPGGGGYIVQRMMSAKDEKHSFFATLWFTVAHYALRPWPWVIVGLVALVMFNLPPSEAGKGYVRVMFEVLPAGLLGLLVASFLAAYMSTITTQLNWGTSYVLNDFYRPFVKSDADEQHYVYVSRITTILTMLVALAVTSVWSRISAVWELLFNMTAGVGLVLILRWFWWRINAWSEIAGFITPMILTPIVMEGFQMKFPFSLYPIVAGTTVVWIAATFLTRPTSRETLHTFYKRVHPGGPLWEPIDEELPDVEGDDGYARLFVDWIAGCVLVFSILFGTGKLIFADYVQGAAALFVAAVCVGFIYNDLRQMGWEKVTGSDEDAVQSPENPSP